MMEIVQIVPRLPPTISGVGDYAFLLAQELRRSHDIHTRFIVCDPNWESAEGNAESRKQKAEIELDGFPVSRLRRRSSEELLELISAPGMPTTVLLQYVGYGYEKRGCPFWLVNGLEKWRPQKAESSGANAEKLKTETLKSEARERKAGTQAEISDVSVSAFSFSARRRLVTMFHELYASGPPWTSAFWTSPLQRHLVKRLTLLSAHCVTNLTLSARALSRMTRRSEKSFSVFPVFSNVGEPHVLLQITERSRRLAIFGSAGWRELVYRQHPGALEQACMKLGLKEIVDIGPPMREVPRISIPYERKGPLAAARVSEELVSCRAGFFACPVHCLGKSGIFAAYAAHGLVPITSTGAEFEDSDGLRDGEHFAWADSQALQDPEHCAQIVRKVHRWYSGHSLSAHAKAVANVLCPSVA